MGTEYLLHARRVLPPAAAMYHLTKKTLLEPDAGSPFPSTVLRVLVVC